MGDYEYAAGGDDMSDIGSAGVSNELTPEEIQKRKEEKAYNEKQKKISQMGDSLSQALENKYQSTANSVDHSDPDNINMYGKI